jgi:hypothetical protein
MLFSSSLLEELAMIMCSLRAIDFPLCIYTNLMNIWINNFDLKIKFFWQHLLYMGNYPKFSILQIRT